MVNDTHTRRRRTDAMIVDALASLQWCCMMDFLMASLNNVQFLVYFIILALLGFYCRLNDNDICGRELSKCCECVIDWCDHRCANILSKASCEGDHECWWNVVIARSCCNGIRH